MGIQERKQREKERRRQQIIVAAKRVFSTKGLTKATMEEIAKEAELSPGTLYLYFKSKDELYASLSLRILQYLIMRLEHIHADKTTSSADRIVLLKNAMFDVYEFDPLILRSMFHLQAGDILGNLSPELVTEVQKLFRKSFGLMASIFRQGIENRSFIDREPEALVDVIWALFSGIVLLEESIRPIHRRDNSFREGLETAFEIFTRGISENPGT